MMHPSYHIGDVRVTSQAETPRHKETAPPNGGAAPVLLVAHDMPNRLHLLSQILLAHNDLVLKVGEAAEQAALGGGDSFFKPLERASDGDSDVVAVLVNHALYQLDVFLV